MRHISRTSSLERHDWVECSNRLGGGGGEVGGRIALQKENQRELFVYAVVKREMGDTATPHSCLKKAA
jgi:hypothetical protein